jgi:nitroreductase
VVKDKEYPLMDIGIAAVQFCLQATAEGLGTCMMGWFNERKIKQGLKIPRTKRLELIITIGYPSTGDIRAKKRKDMSSILSFNSY